jgi:cytochrome b pre-mRNA-processing protein 3
MRRMGEAFYGRAQAYQAALAAADGGLALVEAIARNIYGGSLLEPAGARRLAAYMSEAVRDLSAQGSASLAAGELRFPDPAATLKTTG